MSENVFRPGRDAAKGNYQVDQPAEVNETPTSPDTARSSVSGSGHRPRRRDATIVAAWIGAGAVVVGALLTMIPNLVMGEQSKHSGLVPEGTAASLMPLPAPTCDTCKSGKTYREQAGNGGARTYPDPRVLLGEGERVRPLQEIDVLCKVASPIPESPTVGKYWYLVVSAPWNGRYYTIANSYLNGDPPDHHQGPGKAVVDLRVPDC